MATLIDSLVVKLNLDVTEMRQGMTRLQTDMTKVRNEALEHGKRMEEAGKKAAEFYKHIRNEAIAFFALLVGANGLKEFIRDTNRAEVATGILAKNIGMSVNELDAWGKASARLGGNAQATEQSILAISQAIVKLQTTGEATPTTDLLSKLGISVKDASGRNRDPADIIRDLAAAVQHMPRPQAFSILTSMGMDPGTINLVLQGVEKLNEDLAKTRKVAMTEADVRAAAALNTAYSDLSDTVQRFALDLQTQLSPALTNVLRWMNEWLEANREWLKGQIEEKVRQLSDFLMSIDWPGIVKGAEDIWKQINDLVEKFGGWQTVIEAIVALKLAGWILGLVSPITTVLGLLMSLNPAFAAFMAAAAVIGGAGYAAYKTGEKTGKAADLGFRPSGMPGSIDEFGNVSMWTNPKTGETITADEMDKRLKAMGKGGGDTPAPATGKLSDALGISPEDYDKFRGSVAKIESGGKYNIMGGSSGRFAGKYQMGRQEIEETAARLGEKAPSQQEFLNDPAMQERFFENYTLAHHNELMKNPKYAAMSPQEKAEWLGYAHNQGAGGANTALNTGKVGRDAFNTSGLAYNSAIHAAFRAPSGPDKSLLAGAKPAATQAGSTSTTTTTTSSVDTNINGPIQIHTAATDSDGIAKGIGQSLRKYAVVGQANYGLA